MRHNPTNDGYTVYKVTGQTVVELLAAQKEFIAGHLQGHYVRSSPVLRKSNGLIALDLYYIRHAAQVRELYG